MRLHVVDHGSGQHAPFCLAVVALAQRVIAQVRRACLPPWRAVASLRGSATSCILALAVRARVRLAPPARDEDGAARVRAWAEGACRH